MSSPLTVFLLSTNHIYIITYFLITFYTREDVSYKSLLCTSQLCLLCYQVINECDILNFPGTAFLLRRICETHMLVHREWQFPTKRAIP